MVFFLRTAHFYITRNTHIIWSHNANSYICKSQWHLAGGVISLGATIFTDTKFRLHRPGSDGQFLLVSIPFRCNTKALTTWSAVESVLAL